MTATATPGKRNPAAREQPRFVYHPSFQDADAERTYSSVDPGQAMGSASPHMPDELTRDCARCMHYAAYRWETASTPRERERWERRYFALRDDVILGNHKLIFRAVHKWKSAGYQADDLIGECHLVLIRVVATYNPWLGIRFSTFAFTCLMRALSRLWEKIAAEQKRQPLFLDQLPESDISAGEDPALSSRWEPLEEFFREDHELLSQREKIVLKRRFGMVSPPARTTLEAVGRDLGLSKERVRQLEKGAIDKLRRALAGPLDDHE